MAQSFIKIIRYTFFISVIFIGISFINFKTNKTYKIIDKFDIINKFATRVKPVDIKDLFTKSKIRRKITQYIVIHCDAIDMNIFDHVPAFEIAAEHKQRGLKTFAYHYYITRIGKLYKLHDDDEKTNHAKAVNSVAISVCLQGNFDHEVLNKSQYFKLIKILILLKHKYPNAKIIGHCDVSNKTCPGKNVNVPEINKEVQNFHIFKLL